MGEMSLLIDQASLVERRKQQFETWLVTTQLTLASGSFRDARPVRTVTAHKADTVIISLPSSGSAGQRNEVICLTCPEPQSP